MGGSRWPLQASENLPDPTTAQLPLCLEGPGEAFKSMGPESADTTDPLDWQENINVS